jgi:hypothetical protein
MLSKVGLAEKKLESHGESEETYTKQWRHSHSGDYHILRTALIDLPKT